MNKTFPRIMTNVSRVYQALDTSIFASLLEDRAIGIAIIGAAILHTGLVILGLPSWSCPIREYLRIPCPGCGLSRSITALLHGDWKSALTIHAFGPLFLLAFGMMCVVNLIPKSQRIPIINQVKSMERKTGITAIVLISLVLYWLSRLVFFREHFIGLVMS